MGGLSVLCNTGNCVDVWTNGHFKSTVLRIVCSSNEATKDKGRTSVVFFCFPNHDEVLEAIEGCYGKRENETRQSTMAGDEVPFVFDV